MLPFRRSYPFNKKGNKFNIGAGVWYHPSAAVVLSSNGETVLGKEYEFTSIKDLKSKVGTNDIKDVFNFQDALHYTFDAYLNKNGLAAYFLYMRTNYGENASFGKQFNTAHHVVLQMGYLLTDDKYVNVMPYVGFNYQNPDYTTKSGYQVKIGVSLFPAGTKILGYSSRTDIEYQINNWAWTGSSTSNLYLQLQLVL